MSDMQGLTTEVWIVIALLIVIVLEIRKRK
jgi:hypothetical protein